MTLTKALNGLSMHDLREHCKTRAEQETLAKTVPSDVELKKWIVDLAGTDTEIAPSVKFRDVVSVDAARQGIDGTTIDSQYADSMYNYSLLRLGVHVGDGTKLSEHCSSNELTFKQTSHRGGRTGGLFQNIADAIFLAGQKSESGFVRVKYGDVDTVLTVVKPEFFVGAKGMDIETIPDVLWGQMMKSDGMAAAPAVQLSPSAQSTIVALKSAGINDQKIKDVTIETIPIAELTPEQRTLSDVITTSQAAGEQQISWAQTHIAKASRKR